MSASPSSHLTRIIRSTRVILHTFHGIFLCAAIFPLLSQKYKNLLISYWSRNLLKILNIQLKIEGNQPNHQVKGVMFVGNHISWLDIHVLNSILAVRFVAKSEIRRWPIFGWLAKQGNTLFIRREQKKDAVRVIETASESLMAGDCLCFFPEGTTTDGTQLLKFTSSLMQAPINAKTKIHPFAIEYLCQNGNKNVEVAFAGETTLMISIWRILSLHNSEARITFLDPISSEGHERRGLSISARHAIATHLKMQQN